VAHAAARDRMAAPQALRRSEATEARPKAVGRSAPSSWVARRAASLFLAFQLVRALRSSGASPNPAAERSLAFSGTAGRRIRASSSGAGEFLAHNRGRPSLSSFSARLLASAHSIRSPSLPAFARSNGTTRCRTPCSVCKPTVERWGLGPWGRRPRADRRRARTAKKTREKASEEKNHVCRDSATFLPRFRRRLPLALPRFCRYSADIRPHSALQRAMCAPSPSQPSKFTSIRGAMSA